MTTTTLHTARNRYNDGDRVDVRFVIRPGIVREGWISRADREGRWYWGVAPGVLSNASDEWKQAEADRVAALPGPFRPGDLVDVDGALLEVPAEVARYGNGYMLPAAIVSSTSPAIRDLHELLDQLAAAVATGSTPTVSIVETDAGRVVTVTSAAGTVRTVVLTDRDAHVDAILSAATGPAPDAHLDDLEA